MSRLATIRRDAERSGISGSIDPGHSDAELVTRVREGDDWAAEVLFRRHVDTLNGVITRMVGSRDDAQDIVQDTFLQALTSIDQLAKPEAVKSWLLTIAVRKVHRRFRRQRILKWIGLEDAAQDATLETFVSPEASPEQRAELARLHDVLQRCTIEQRTAWLLRYVEQHTLPEVAETCHCSLAAAKRRIAAAQARVRKHLGEAKHG